MSHEIISCYLNNNLKPQLATFNTPPALVEAISASVRDQMQSCIFHWNDVPFRKALLVVGEEEGGYYLPRAKDDIRNFVVVTLRNSALESIHADSYFPPGYGKRLESKDLRTITAAAIDYFMKVDLSAMADQISTPHNDIYGALSVINPISWTALSELANTTKQIIEYEPVSVVKKSGLANLKLQKAINSLFFNDNRAQFMHITSDGYSLTIDHGLQHIIQTVEENEMPFVGDSFKGVSRNFEKLITVMEYILSRDLAFITSNYFITNGYIERRVKPVKPGNDLPGMKRNWLNGNGITRNHRSWLKAAAEA